MPTWVRCRDRDTGHEFDLHADDLRVTDGTVEVLTDYPENTGLTATPRPPKHRVDLAGQSQPSPATAPAEETTP
jgi:hypothetical protein